MRPILHLRRRLASAIVAGAAIGCAALADDGLPPHADTLEALLVQARDAVNSEPADALALSQELLRRLEDEPNHELRARALHVTARAFSLQSHYRESISVGEQALRLATAGHLPELLRADILGDLSTVYARTGEAGASFALQQQAFEIRERLGDPSGAASSLATIAELYSNVGRIEDASGLYDEALDYARASGDAYQTVRILNNYAFMWILNDEPALALGALDEARALGDQHGNRLLIGYTHQNTAHALLKLGRHDEMEPYLETALAVAEEFDQPVLLTGVYFTYARLAFARGGLDAATAYANDAIAQAHRVDYTERLSDLHELLARIAAAAGDHETAYVHMQRHQLFLAAVADEDLEESQVLFEAQREVAAQQQELELLRRDAELNELGISRARTTRNAALFIAGLLGLVMFVLGAFLREKARAKKTVDAKNRELAKAHGELLLATKAKSQFLSVMSHELRTPLNAVLGFSDIIAAQRLGAIGNDQYLEFAGHINVQGRRLLGLVEDILLATEAESGALVLHEDEANVNEIVSLALNEVAVLHPGAEARVHTETCSDTVTLCCDAQQLSRAIAKLIDNALKFSPDAAPVRLGAHVGADGALHVRITDRGPGVDADQASHLMKLFQQADDRLARTKEGAGLGLPIAKFIAEAHDGTLVITRAPEGGACVEIRLPETRVTTAASARADDNARLCA